jgi:hypothetical protein
LLMSGQVEEACRKSGGLPDRSFQPLMPTHAPSGKATRAHFSMSQHVFSQRCGR